MEPRPLREEQNLVVRLSQEDRVAMKKLAVENDRSLAAELRRAVREYLAKHRNGNDA